MSKGRPPQLLPLVVVVYRKRQKGKAYLATFKDTNVDSIINGKKHTSLIPDNYIIEEIGVGKSFIQEYQEAYKINKIKEL
jgi:hypothetical protein|tara:strand:+ start:611 stop:850 length:240 start_codon:yes stop_codon:yes gene_type:complete